MARCFFRRHKYTEVHELTLEEIGSPPYHDRMAGFNMSSKMYGYESNARVFVKICERCGKMLVDVVGTEYALYLALPASAYTSVIGLAIKKRRDEAIEEALGSREPKVYERLRYIENKLYELSRDVYNIKAIFPASLQQRVKGGSCEKEWRLEEGKNREMNVVSEDKAPMERPQNERT